MDKTIASLKVGERLVLGKYGVQNGVPYPIVWLKATPNNDFISEYVLDYTLFDAKERNSDNDYRYNGNPNFDVSNLFSYLNSDGESWYQALHPLDEPPPERFNFGIRLNHFGFLYHFEDYELSSLCQVTYDVGDKKVCSLIRLPSFENIMSDRRFPLFKKRGIRTKGTADMIDYSRAGYGYNSYIPYWLMDVSARSQTRVSILGRDGIVDSGSASNSYGVRPVCTLKPDLAVSVANDGFYHIIPYEVPTAAVCTDEELLTLLGMK